MHYVISVPEWHKGHKQEFFAAGERVMVRCVDCNVIAEAMAVGKKIDLQSSFLDKVDWKEVVK